MYFGIAISLACHAALLAWAFLTIQSTPQLRLPESEPISVAIVTPSDLLRMKQGSETAKELEAKKAEEPKPQTSVQEAPKSNPILAPTPPAEPAKPVEEAKAEPKPDPIADKLAAMPPEPEPAPGPTPDELKKIEDDKKAEDQRKAEAKKAEEKKAEEKRKAEEKKKAEQKKLAEAKRKEDEKKKTSAADRLAALLNKDPTKKGAPVSGTEPTNYSGPTAGTAKGTESVLSLREQDLMRGMLSSQLKSCWTLAGGGGGVETPVVVLKWRMRPDGILDGEPQLVQSASGPLAQLANEAAIRAVKKCQPFNLPPDLYATGWKEITWEFDPSAMM